MSEKFHEITKAIFDGKLPATYFCVVVPTAIFMGTIGSQEDISEFLKIETRGITDRNPLDIAKDQISAKMTYLESLDQNPAIPKEKIITMINAKILSGELEIQLPIVHIVADKVMAWGPGTLDANNPAN